MKEILILGIGNEYLSDDGIGPKIAMDLAKTGLNQYADFKTCYISGLDLLQEIEEYKKLVLIDATVHPDVKPGEVCIFEDIENAKSLHLDNFHDISFKDSIKLGKEAGLYIPEEIHIISIGIIEDKLFSKELSKHFERKYSAIFSENSVIYQSENIKIRFNYSLASLKFEIIPV